MSPSNSTRKTTYIDLFSCLYDRKWSKTLPVHVRKRSYVSVHNRMYASVFYALVLHIGVSELRATLKRLTNTQQHLKRFGV